MSVPIRGPLAPTGWPSNSEPPEDKRARFREAISLWVGNIRLNEAMKREELAQLEGLQRHLALSKNLVPTAIRICRLYPRADTKTPLMVLISLLCDNNDGICRLTIKRMAQLFARTERSIRQTIDELEQAGLLFVNRVDGFPSNYWPAVAPVLAEANAAVTWFVDALSDKPAARGRPVTEGLPENPGTSGPEPRNERAETPERASTDISLTNIFSPTNGEHSCKVGPHLGKAGFVISAEYKLIIPMVTIETWRKRFPAIPDLEAQLQKLASIILCRGAQHPGWNYPREWIAGCLAEDNQKAADTARITNAKIANAQRGQPTKTFKR